MSGFKTRKLSHLFLPWTLQGGTCLQAKGTHPSKDGGAAGAGGKKPGKGA